MESLIRVGLLGCGSIGTTIVEALYKDSSINAEILYLFDGEPGKAERLQTKIKRELVVTSSFEDFTNAPFDLLLECASQEAVRSYGEKALRAGKDLLIMSVGALMDDAFRNRLASVAKEVSKNLYLPSGAIGGLDILRAAKEGKLYEVNLITSKNPSALAGAPYFQEHAMDPDEIQNRMTLFEGTAKEAVKLFPANVNVAAILSLAGLGGEKTKVKIVADPQLKINIHQIEIKGDFGEAKITVQNLPHPENPKTSYLAALSAIETLRRACAKGPRL
ncbi:MAG: aspartate dehydrogenase [Deltaproteobacteria bacterium]|nr:aspartate dehydrogenase [Deltaproteobacteria bacterium]